MKSLIQLRIAILFILIAALAVRLGAGFWWQSRLPPASFAFGDSGSYWTLAQAIARGEPYRFGMDGSQVFRTPGYPLVLAPLFLLSDDPPVMWARVQSALLGTVSVGLVSWLAARLLDQRAAVVAATIAAFSPDSVALGTFVLSEAPFCPLMLLQIILWDVSWRAETTMGQLGGAFASGLSAGAATLMRPSWLLFTPFVLGLVFVLGPRRGIQLKMGLAALIGLCLAMSPWWLRNYHVVDRFVPTNLQVGASLYDGLHEGATGSSDMRFVSQFYAEQREADATSSDPPRGLFEERLDARMRDASVRWVRSHPGQAVKLAWIKFLRIWSPVPHATELQNPLLRWTIFLGYVPVMFCALWGAWRYLRWDWPYVLCVLPALYLTLLHVIFVGSMRYRQPAMLTLFVLAAGAVAGSMPKRVNRSMSKTSSRHSGASD